MHNKSEQTIETLLEWSIKAMNLLEQKTEMTEQERKAAIENLRQEITSISPEYFGRAPKKLYNYALYYRPADVSTVPKGFVELHEKPGFKSEMDAHRSSCNHGYVTYDRKLTNAEASSYELALMLEKDDKLKVADNIIEAMGEYKSRYLQHAKLMSDMFINHISDQLDSRHDLGYRPSYGDINEMVRIVKDRLLEAVDPSPKKAKPSSPSM